MTLFDYALATMIVALTWVLYNHKAPTKLPLPPGPKGLPVLGNVYDLPKDRAWVTYMKWAKEYGSDIIHINLAGTTVIILNSDKAARDLMEKKSSLYSDRPRYPMLKELVGWDRVIGFQPYGNEWRERRRMFHQYFNLAAVPKYHSRTLQCARELVLHILDDPRDDPIDHLRLMAGSIILNIVYGLDIQNRYNPYLTIAEKALHSMAMTGNPGSYLVDSLPALKYIPAWFPGAKFRRQAHEWRKSVSAMVSAPFGAVKTAIADGDAVPSIVATLLGAVDMGSETTVHQEQVISEMAASAYTGGADTTVSSLGTFFLAMLLYPEVQRKAQEEIDRVLGKDRLPDFSDQASLPYVTAIVKETLRWRPVLPMAIPHRLNSDDIYNGYRIPAGSVIVGNSWAILHDENIYPDPDAFKPERFLTDDGQLNPKIPDVDVAFGYGRRICPGRYQAADSTWMAVASVLFTLEISKPIDSQGHPIQPSAEYSDGMLCYPLPFKCSMKPRSAAAEALIRASTENNK